MTGLCQEKGQFEPRVSINFEKTLTLDLGLFFIKAFINDHIIHSL